MFLRIEGVPPSGIVFEPFGEPSHLRGKPFFFLAVFEDMVVLASHLDECHLTAQEFQGSEHLETLDERHVGIGIAMKQKQRRMDLVSIEEISADIEAPGYDFSFSDWSSSLGCLVADTRQTQDNLISLLAQYLLEAGLFGTDTDARERKLEEVTEDLDKAMQDIHAGEGIPADEVFDEIRRKHGFPVPEKDPEQDGLKSRIYSAIAEYAMYSRTRERRRILASIAGT